MGRGRNTCQVVKRKKKCQKKWRMKILGPVRQCCRKLQGGDKQLCEPKSLEEKVTAL